MTTTHASQAAETASKYIYFVLAAIAAALGYTVEHAESPAYTVRYLLFPAASFSWILSFYLGLRGTQERLTSLNLMANIEQLETGMNLARKNLDTLSLKKFESDFCQSIIRTNKALEQRGASFETYISWQFKLLAVGAISYMGWKMLPLINLP